MWSIAPRSEPAGLTLAALLISLDHPVGAANAAAGLFTMAVAPSSPA
jgi:hypothetical protein